MFFENNYLLEVYRANKLKESHGCLETYCSLKMSISPFFAKNGGKSFYFFYSKEDTAIALVFIMYDGS